MQPYHPYTSSLICTHFFGASYLPSGLDDTAGLAWWCCCLNGNEQVCVSERHCRACLVWGEAAATQSGGDSRREGGRKSGTESTDSPFSSSAVSEGGDGVVGWSAVLKYYHIIVSSILWASSFIFLYLFYCLSISSSVPICTEKLPEQPFEWQDCSNVLNKHNYTCVSTLLS